MQKDGIRLIEPNDNLSKKYIEEAGNDFIEMKNLNSSKWKNVTAYYSCYNSVYAILQKIGIKCEIHDCTIELIDIISDNLGITKEQIELLKSLKKKRIDSQYYLKDQKNLNEKEVASFILNCKHILSTLNEDKIKKTRGDIIKRHKNE